MNFFRPVSFVLFIFCSCLFYTADAQFQIAYIGVNGLTCSQCSRTVEMSIRKLDFVSDVEMNLEHTEGKIILKSGRKADMDKIAQAVTDAGFSLRYLQADLVLDHSVNTTEQCFNYKGDRYVLTDSGTQQLNGLVHLKFLGKKYLPKNEFHKVEKSMVDKCGGRTTGKTYFVRISSTNI